MGAYRGLIVYISSIGLTGRPEMATIGLCMIVRNEADVITRCIESVRRLVPASTNSQAATPHEVINASGTPGF